MTNREVQLEVEARLAEFAPLFADSEEFRLEINSLVEMVKFEMDIPQGMAVKYLRDRIQYHTTKLPDIEKKAEDRRLYLENRPKAMIGEVRYYG